MVESSLVMKLVHSFFKALVIGCAICAALVVGYSIGCYFNWRQPDPTLAASLYGFLITYVLIKTVVLYKHNN